MKIFRLQALQREVLWAPWLRYWRSHVWRGWCVWWALHLLHALVQLPLKLSNNARSANAEMIIQSPWQILMETLRCNLRKVVILWIIWVENLKIKEGTGCRPCHQQGGQPSIAFNTSLPSIALRLGYPQVLELCPILTQEQINPDQMYNTWNLGVHQEK